MTQPERIPCSCCEAMILPATAKTTGGLCMPCKKAGPPKDPIRDLAGLLTAAEEVGLSTKSEFIRKCVKPTVDIRLSSDEANLLQSRFGGVPALPASFEWPTHNIGRYQFLGQINFSDIASCPEELPDSGILSLFFATDPDGEIFWQDPGYILAYYFSDLTELAPHPSPDGSEPPASKMLMETSVGLPTSADLIPEHPFSDDDEADLFFYELPEKTDAPTNYLLGYPSFNSLAYDPTPGDEWISLITLRSHDQLDWCWHDGGKLMVFIEKQKLAIRDFSNLNCDAG